MSSGIDTIPDNDSLASPPKLSTDTIRVFCGSDRSQQLPLQVLTHSIERRTKSAVEVRAIDNRMVPLPDDPRFAPYTEFSFARFVIPALCEFSGKAIYMDSDMLVFADIAELWATDLDGAKIAIEVGSRQQSEVGKHSAVMLLDCTALDWDVTRIVADLGTRYDYKALMAIDPLLRPGEMREAIVPGWNDLDAYDPTRTRNLHFSRIRSQPWVFAAHPHGQLWVNEMALMLDSGALHAAAVIEEVRLGYARPSLLLQLGIDASGATTAAPVRDTDALLAHDRNAEFVAHRKLVARKAERKRAIARADCERASARRPWLAPWYRLLFKLRQGG
ncbi:MAG: glycosyltransferase [Lysobacteraceae bacterium]